MPDYTLKGIKYPLDGDNIKAASVAAKLAADIRAVATTTDTAIGVEGERAENAAIEAATWDRTADSLISTANIYTLPPGLYRPVSNSAATSMGLPTANYGELAVTDVGNGKVLKWTPASSTPGFYINRRVGSTAWTGWAKFEPAPETRPGSVEREMRLARAAARRGGRYGTNGVAVLSLVFDHGSRNFLDKVLPILQEAGVPATLGLNSSMYESGYIFADSDAGTSFSQLQTMALNNGVSIWNHGRWHTAGGESEIIGGRDDLQAVLPQVPIENWLHTGTYGDFSSGDTFARYWENDIGRTIMNAHAYLTGDIQEPIMPLNGAPKPGYDGEWIDAGASPLATVKTLVQDAQKVGGAVMTRQHPMFLDTSGKITTTQLREFVLWAASERDAGRLLVLTADLLNLADASTGHRRNLTDGTGGTGTQTRTVSIGDNALAAGSVNEVHATVRLSTAGKVKLTATATGLAATRAVDVPAKQWVDLRAFFTIPAWAKGNLAVQVEQFSGTGLQVHQLNIYPA